VGAADLSVIDEDGVRVVKVGPMGPYNNNAYLVRDVAAGQTLLVDMPLEEGPLLEAIAAEGNVRTIVATHWHSDHWMTYDAVRGATGAPVLVGRDEINIPADRIDRRVDDGEEIRVGSISVTVVNTPGHTPGSISLRVGRVLISGDTLFDGGPGKTFARGNLETLLQTIQAKLLPLPEETLVLPGHGGTTTIGDSRRGYAEYLTHPKPAGYFGDVTWSP
jgi:hydroxyacylglutathione hydrolase